ncbi:hypothetical protein K2X85_05660 [bacterium]|jgi:hypothetical protein|nr:hypothetical protein [bacterium]
MRNHARPILWTLPALAGLAWGDEAIPSRASSGPSVSNETVVIEDVPPGATVIHEGEVLQEGATSPPRRIFQNPPSRVRQGPFVRRIIPSRFAKPFNDGPNRYEPRLYDVRLLPKQLTLPGNEGERETLYSLPPRDRGYFILNRW